MTRKDERDITESVSASGSSSGRTVSLAATNSQEEHDDDFSAKRDAKPPLGPKLTVYRLLFITTMLSFVMGMDILTIKGQVNVPTRLDMVSGGLLAVGLCWIGFREQRNAKKWEWFFEFDLVPAIGYFIMRAIGSVVLLLFGGECMLLSLSATYSIGTCLLRLLPIDRSDVHLPFGADPDICLGTFVSVFILFLAALTFTGRARARARARVWAGQSFVNDYGPDAPLAVGYRRFGVVGTIVGLLCGFALLMLPTFSPVLLHL